MDRYDEGGAAPEVGTRYRVPMFSLSVSIVAASRLPHTPLRVERTGAGAVVRGGEVGNGGVRVCRVPEGGVT